MCTLEPDPFPPEPSPIHVVVAAASDTGRHRDNNEDRVVVVDLRSGAALTSGESAGRAWPGGWLAAVCDGMGGEAGGEIASTLATQVLVDAMARAEPVLRITGRAARVAEAIEHAMKEASRAVYQEAQRTPALARMGTTATAVALAAGELVIGQVGDSRAYLLRRGALTQLTRDQTLVAFIAAQTRRDPSEVAETIGANIILQAVGAKPTVDVALTRVPIEDGDQLLLCSDGLSGPLPDDAIRDILERAGSAADACRALVDAANAAGGPDNVSCIVARFSLLREPAPRDPR